MHKKFTVEEKQEIYKKPFEEQFETIKLGNIAIKAHLTFKEDEKDIKHLIKACEHFIKEGKTPYLMPVIHKAETEARRKLFSAIHTNHLILICLL